MLEQRFARLLGEVRKPAPSARIIRLHCANRCIIPFRVFCAFHGQNNRPLSQGWLGKY